jgi:hypothetical protein
MSFVIVIAMRLFFVAIYPDYQSVTLLQHFIFLSAGGVWRLTGGVWRLADAVD